MTPAHLASGDTPADDGASAGAVAAVRRAGPGDAALLARLGRELFADTFGAANTPSDMRTYLDETFTEQRMHALLGDPRAVLWIAEAGGGSAVGYAQLRVDAPLPPGASRFDVAAPDPARGAEIVRLYAARGLHGRGLGAALMAACLDAAAAAGATLVWLGVWERNARAIAFYEKHGFRKAGEQEFVLGADRQRDWVMARAVTRRDR